MCGTGEQCAGSAIGRRRRIIRRRQIAAERNKREAPVRVELTMADLQSAALATWLRRLRMWSGETSYPFRPAVASHLRKSYAIGETWSSSHEFAGGIRKRAARAKA